MEKLQWNIDFIETGEDPEMQETVSKTNPIFPTNVTIFWTKLLTGSLFGALSYFIRRFYFEWEFLWAIPLFAIASYVIALVIVVILGKTNKSVGGLLKTSAAYTGTWMMSYLVLGGLCFLGGW
ncbi:MAG: hypothetical protein RTS72_03115 [Candidatus Thorarchaeota archaeon]